MTFEQTQILLYGRVIKKDQMKNKMNPSKAQTKHWKNVGNWAFNSSSSEAVKRHGERVVKVATAGGNVLEHCLSSYAICLRLWMK